MLKPIFYSVVLLTALSASSCTHVQRPRHGLDLPPASSVETADLSRWWEDFEDPTLTALVEEALSKNSDVLLAASRIDEAFQAMRLAGSGRFPSLNVTGDARRTHGSALSNQSFSTGTDDDFSLGFSASYEVDLWGRLRSIRKAAQARLAATGYARDVVNISVPAQVARAYFFLRAMDADEELLKKTLETRHEAVELQKIRLDAGLINQYVFTLSESERDAVAAELPGVSSARQQAEIALAVLLGRTPAELVNLPIHRGRAVDDFSMAPQVPAGLPSDLLLRRPDVRASEQLLAAAEYDISSARARWFPLIQLTGFYGGESSSLSDILTSAARTWNIGPELLQPIIGLGYLKDDYDRRLSIRDQAEIVYQQTARQAYADVLSALAGHRGSLEQVAAAENYFGNQTKLRALAEDQFKAGHISRMDVLDVESRRLQAERGLIAAQRHRLENLVNVYQALGGGWKEQ